MTILPIDAVITWIDGQDKDQKEKLGHYLTSAGLPELDSTMSTRYDQCGEINYCVRSLLRFAPWVRTIYIVTDNQIPPIIKTLKNTIYENKIKLIDHRDIFLNYESALPTFNSLAIESVLWRIEGLSNNFIYLNDDCALIRPVKPEDFFRDNKLVLRGSWKIPLARKWQHRCMTFLGYQIPTNEHRTLQENTAKLVGWEKKFFHLPHEAFPLHKHTIEHFFHEHPETFSQNIHYPIRNQKQFWPISLAQHLEIKNNLVVFDNTLKAVSINGACHSINKIKRRLTKAEKSNVAFICVQSLDLAPKATQQIIFDWLDKKIPF